MPTLPNRTPTFRIACTAFAWTTLSVFSLFGQPADAPAAFTDKLEQLQVELYQVLDSDFKPAATTAQDFQPCDFAWHSRKDKLEIRYLALPWKEGDPASQYPHILAARTAAHVATNAEGAPMTLLSLGSEELDAFGADWGVAYFFMPKSLFAAQRHCELLVLHKEARGTILVFFLFDDPDNPALDLWFQHLAFKE
jgi:hypothetical protein